MGSTFVTPRPGVPPPPPPPPPSLPGARRSSINDTILTAGPGGAKNPLPGSIAATRGLLNGDTILTRALTDTVAAPRAPAGADRPGFLEPRYSPPNATLAAGTDGDKKSLKPLTPGEKNAIRSLSKEKLKILGKNERFQDYARFAGKVLGERIDEENDLAEGKIFHQSVLKKNLPRMSELELANVLASRGFINPRAIAKRGYPAVFDAIIRSKKEHNPVNSLSSENSLNDIKQKIPLDFRFMRGEGRDIVIDMALEIIEGKRDRFPGEGDFIFVGGHLLKRKVAALAADILHAKGTDEIIALGEKIRKLNTMEKENEFESAFRIAKGEKKKSKKSEILTESQIRSLLRIAEDKINGRISRKSSRQDLYFRIGKSFETLDERVALRKTIKPSIDDE